MKIPSLSIFAALAVLALAALPAMAQHMNATDAPCRGVVITSDAAACFSDALTLRNRELAELLHQVRPAIAGDELSLLNQAEAAWLEYRRLSCQAEYAMYGGGTGGSVTRLACMEALTRDRLRQLHDSYDWRVEKYEWTRDHPSVR
jgi:uncharacterized protein YecT (DUF1311 family)